MVGDIRSNEGLFATDMQSLNTKGTIGNEVAFELA